MLFAMGHVQSLSGLRQSSTLILLALLSILLTSQTDALAQSASTDTDCPAPDTILITEYPIPTAGSELSGITAGPDGALWFGEDVGAIGRITVDGEITEYPLPDTNDAQPFVVAGPDGAVWFTDIGPNMIGRITLEGRITRYAIQSGSSIPAGITVGADDAIWFTEHGTHQIGRITMEGEITEYPTPSVASGPVGITLGPDGAVWFTERSANQIGRITTDGEITEYPVQTPGSFLLRIAAGPDDALWFTEHRGNKIGRIATEGEITEYGLPRGAGPVGITAGSDNAIWFTEFSANKIGCITTEGEITEYEIPTSNSEPFSITMGVDGAIWFTENASNKIGRLQVQTQSAVTPITALEAQVVAEWNINMPADFAFGFDSVWVPSHRSPNVTTRIDPITNEITAVIQGTGYRSHQALVVGDMLWVTGEQNDLAPIDLQTNTIGTGVTGAHPYIAYGFDSIWGVTLTDELDRIDPTTRQVTASIELGNGYVDCNNHVLVMDSAVWVLHCDEGELIQIDPATDRIVSKTPYAELVDEAETQTIIPTGKGTDFIWVLVSGGLLRIDPNTTSGLTYLPLTRKQIGDGWFTVTDEAVWIGGDGQIARFNIATKEIDMTYEVHPGFANVGIGFGSVWVAYEQEGLVQRLDVAP